FHESAGRIIWPGFPASFDGIWESHDDNARFRLEIKGASIKWIERKRDDSDLEISRNGVIKRTAQGTFEVERAFDDELVKFQFNARFQEVVDGHPEPSVLQLQFSGARLIGAYIGVMLRPSGEIQRSNPTDYTFVNTIWRAP